MLLFIYRHSKCSVMSLSRSLVDWMMFLCQQSQIWRFDFENLISIMDVNFQASAFWYQNFRSVPSGIRIHFVSRCTAVLGWDPPQVQQQVRTLMPSVVTLSEHLLSAILCSFAGFRIGVSNCCRSVLSVKSNLTPARIWTFCRWVCVFSKSLFFGWWIVHCRHFIDGFRWTRLMMSRCSVVVRCWCEQETAWVRESNWTGPSIPHDLQDRRVEITGPVDR